MEFKTKISRKLFPLFIFLNITAFSFSQSSSTAQKQIAQLKSGALLIKLRTSENAINGLIERGKMDEAEKLKLQQGLENKEIIDAFKNNFTFTKVFFFYSNNAKKIKEDNLKGCLINVNNEIDTSFNSNDFLIGEFGQTETNRIDAFIIEDENLDQLKKPFPFQIRLNKYGVSTRSKAEMAKAVNDELTFFWNKNSVK